MSKRLDFLAAIQRGFRKLKPYRRRKASMGERRRLSAAAGGYTTFKMGIN
jgi:hypothetical protein